MPSERWQDDGMATLTLRIPDAMHELIKKAAEDDVRSVNEQITWLLRLGLDVRATHRTGREGG